MKKLSLFLTVFLASAFSFAGTTHKVMDGTSARCSENADLGMPAIKISLVDSMDQEDIRLISVKVKTFKCSQVNGKLQLVGAPLTQARIANHGQLEIVLFDDQTSQVFGILDADISLEEQVLDVGIPKSVSLVDAAARVNHQGLVNFGSFRIRLQ